MRKIIRAMFNLRKIGAIRHLIARKNAQIRAEREKYEAERAANSILTAYIFCIASGCGVIRIPKASVSAALEKYESRAYCDGDDYVIEVKNAVASREGDLRGEAGKLQAMV